MLEIKPKKYNFKLRKNQEGNFVHTSTNQNAQGQLAKYLLADCQDPEENQAFGKQTRKIVKPIFEGSLTFENMRDAVEAGIINKETGVSSKPIAGYFVDIPVGFVYEREGANGQKFRNRTVSVFVMEGENFEVVKDRAIRSVQHLRVQTDDDLQASEEQRLNQEANTASGSSDF